MSLTTTRNEVRSVNLEPQTVRTPTFNTSDLVLSIIGGTARAAVGAGAAIVSSLHSLAQKAREDEARGVALAARQMALKPVSRRALEAEASGISLGGATGFKNCYIDLALYDGNPFEYTTHCTGVLINGREFPGENYGSSNAEF